MSAGCRGYRDRIDWPCWLPVDEKISRCGGCPALATVRGGARIADLGEIVVEGREIAFGIESPDEPGVKRFVAIYGRNVARIDVALVIVGGEFDVLLGPSGKYAEQLGGAIRVFSRGRFDRPAGPARFMGQAPDAERAVPGGECRFVQQVGVKCFGQAADDGGPGGGPGRYIGASRSTPWRAAPAAEKIANHWSPEPLRIDAIFSPSAHAWLNE